jgi:hypothetical protein
MQYSVELREHTESGDDYTEEHYDFDTKSEAVAFARKYIGELHSILDYGEKNCNPKDITHLA